MTSALLRLENCIEEVSHWMSANRLKLQNADKTKLLWAGSPHGPQKFDRGLTYLLHDELHWLDVPQWMQYKLCAPVHRCLQHKAPPYMTDCCIHTSRHCSLEASAVRRLPSAIRTATPAFDVRSSLAGPAARNSLPDYLRHPSRSFDSFRRDLKTFLFSFL